MQALLAAVVAAGMASVFAAGPASAAPDAPTPVPPQPGTAPGAAVVDSSPVMAYTGTNGTVWVKDLSTGVYTYAGGDLLAGPALVASGSSVVVFGPGTKNELEMTTCGLGAADCSAWTSLGGYITSKAGTVFRGPSAADYSVYARGQNGAVWGIDHSSTGWGPWYSAGGDLYGGTGPSAAFINGSIYLLVTWENEEVRIALLGGSWSPTGGYSTATPALTTIAGALVGFARGTNPIAAYYHRFLDTSPGWFSMGGQFSSGLAAASNGVTTTYTFGLGTNSEVYGATGSWTAYPPTLTGWMPET
jgi:hypothetical protein